MNDRDAHGTGCAIGCARTAPRRHAPGGRLDVPVAHALFSEWGFAGRLLTRHAAGGRAAAMAGSAGRRGVAQSKVRQWFGEVKLLAFFRQLYPPGPSFVRDCIPCRNAPQQHIYHEFIE
jgi:hypothetical protein